MLSSENDHPQETQIEKATSYDGLFDSYARAYCIHRWHEKSVFFGQTRTTPETLFSGRKSIILTAR